MLPWFMLKPSRFMLKVGLRLCMTATQTNALPSAPGPQHRHDWGCPPGPSPGVCPPCQGCQHLQAGTRRGSGGDQDPSLCSTTAELHMEQRQNACACLHSSVLGQPLNCWTPPSLCPPRSQDTAAPQPAAQQNPPFKLNPYLL